jgi:hypothetical protein
MYRSNFEPKVIYTVGDKSGISIGKIHEYIMLDAFPRSAGDHLAQNFLRKI